MMKTNGKMKNNSNVTLVDLFSLQMDNQTKMLMNGMYDIFKLDDTIAVPVDDTKLMSYHIQQLMSEIGEVLEADKRWKNFRNQKYDKDAKLEEIADCFIVLMNVTMFSDVNGEELTQAIINKLNKVKERLL